MRSFRILILTLCLTATLAPSARAQKQRELSLEECITIALQHNFSVRIARFNPEIARYALSSSYGGYDPIFFFKGQHDYNLSPGGVDTQGRSYSGTETDTDKFNTGIQGLLPWGMTYSLGGSVSDQWGHRPDTINDLSSATLVTNTLFQPDGTQFQYLSTNYSTITIKSPFETTAGQVGFLELRQPLLKDFWIDATRVQIFVNKQELKSKELSLRGQIMTTITDVERAYYNLIFAQENVKVQQKAVELAERLVAENKRRVEVGAMAPLDEKQAESQAAASRADLLGALGDQGTAERVLKNLLSDDYKKNWMDAALSPTEKLVALPQKYDLQDSWRIGLAQRPDFLALKLGLAEQDYRVRFQKNQLYPAVDLIGAYGYNASGQEYSDAFGQFRRGDNPFYSFGAQLTIPLSQQSTRNNLKAAKAGRQQLDLQVKALEQTIIVGIEDAIAVANTSFARVGATREARLYAEAALDAEQKKLESGKSTSFEVLRLQRDLTQARSTEIRALADYNIALAAVAFNEGTTLERRHVDLKAK